MTIQFFGRLKYIVLEGQGHLTTWHTIETPTVLALHPMVTESGAMRFERDQRDLTPSFNDCVTVPSFKVEKGGGALEMRIAPGTKREHDHLCERI